MATIYDDAEGHRINGGPASDLIFGRGGSDTIYGWGGRDVIRGGSQGDSLAGGQDADVLSGDGGDDLIRGDGGADQLFGGTGNDTLYGGKGADTMFGGAGNDRFSVESLDVGVDKINGGAGSDFLWMRTEGDVIAANLATGTVKGLGDVPLATLTSVESISAIAANLTVIAGTAGANVIEARGGVDNVVDGGAGNDTISGSGWNGRLDGGAGDDLIHAGASGFLGVQNLTGGTGDDTISGEVGYVNMTGGAGDDEFQFGSGIGTIRGTPFATRATITDYQAGETIQIELYGPDELTFLGEGEDLTGPQSLRYGEVIYVHHSDGDTVIWANVSDDAGPMQIRLDGFLGDLSAGDFNLL